MFSDKAKYAVKSKELVRLHKLKYPNYKYKPRMKKPRIKGTSSDMYKGIHEARMPQDTQSGAHIQIINQTPSVIQSYTQGQVALRSMLSHKAGNDTLLTPSEDLQNYMEHMGSAGNLQNYTAHNAGSSVQNYTGEHIVGSAEIEIDNAEDDAEDLTEDDDVGNSTQPVQGLNYKALLETAYAAAIAELYIREYPKQGCPKVIFLLCSLVTYTIYFFFKNV